MNYSVLLAKFTDDKEGNQAFEKLSKGSFNDSYLVNQMILAVRKDDKLEIEDIFDSGKDTRDDAILGGIIGGLFGIFSGPIGFLLWGSLGMAIGNVKDTSDAVEDMSLLERVSQLLGSGELAILALVEEDDLDVIDILLKEYDAEVVRFDASEVQYEVDKANELQEELEKETKDKMREERSGARKEKLEEIKNKIKEEFKNLRSIVK
ncbi:DUF1269 domain-containing protein [Peptostreptococcaceae bacterium OttesenSCG-928-C18]|nr:DUF1269 domain-containing protein [Peptostreptococcaceae bacterium OttesenSCG-928-C18]